MSGSKDLLKTRFADTAIRDDLIALANPVAQARHYGDDHTGHDTKAVASFAAVTVQLAAAWCWGAGQCMLDPTCAALADLWPGLRNPWVLDAPAATPVPPQPPPGGSASSQASLAGGCASSSVVDDTIALVAADGTRVELGRELVAEYTCTVAKMINGARSSRRALHACVLSCPSGWHDECRSQALLVLVLPRAPAPVAPSECPELANAPIPVLGVAGGDLRHFEDFCAARGSHVAAGDCGGSGVWEWEAQLLDAWVEAAPHREASVVEARLCLRACVRACASQERGALRPCVQQRGLQAWPSRWLRI